MSYLPIEPLNTGQRIRRRRRKSQTRRWVRFIFRNRRLLLTVLWVARAIVKIAQIIGYMIDGS